MPGWLKQTAVLLTSGPRGLRPLWRRATVEAMCLVGVGLLAGSAAIHIHLWQGGYGAIPTVGPLFLFQGVAAAAAALVLLLLRRAVVMLVGAVFLVSTAAGLLLSHFFGLFGYKENLAVPYAGMSLYLEFIGAAVLVVAAAVTMLAAWRRQKVGRTPD